MIFAAYFTLRGRYTYAHARKTLVLTELSASIDKDPYLCVNEKANGDYSSSVYNSVFTHVASVYANLLEQKKAFA